MKDYDFADITGIVTYVLITVLVIAYLCASAYVIFPMVSTEDFGSIIFSLGILLAIWSVISVIIILLIGQPLTFICLAVSAVIASVSKGIQWSLKRL
ncbi:hypothetical protein [Phocoenobacter skyensis]|uniref:Uncharacterized protein n=1 Tax=Phocoenobacter skyensis TaxID=97481 RepID=A0ABT9JN25_9PAST|nr:hypothetical protein [Pasteurella skyensis]MDP8080249.1 hypothetical protein [Pasteurella skyensis]MDP8086212.1 hypothetical protein [Pasteurella skyensis]